MYLPALVPNLYLLPLAPNLHLPALALNLYLQSLAPNFYLPSWPQICICRSWPAIFIISPESEHAYVNYVPEVVFDGLATICITGPGPEFAFTFLLVVKLAAGVISFE